MVRPDVNYVCSNYLPKMLNKSQYNAIKLKKRWSRKAPQYNTGASIVQSFYANTNRQWVQKLQNAADA